MPDETNGGERNMDDKLSDTIEKSALIILLAVGVLTILSSVFDFSFHFGV
jgi:hypothetical protein